MSNQKTNNQKTTKKWLKYFAEYDKWRIEVYKWLMKEESASTQDDTGSNPPTPPPPPPPPPSDSK